MNAHKLDRYTTLLMIVNTLATLSATAMTTSITTPPATTTTIKRRNLTSSSTTTSTRQEPASPGMETGALAYLQRYGYMQAASGAEINNLVSEDSFSEAVAEFQRFAGLAQTGSVDKQTLELMRLPRCGNSDKPQAASSTSGQLARITKSGQLATWRHLPMAQDQHQVNSTTGERRRRKRYALQGSKWRRQELTYRISQYPTRFSGKRHEVDDQIERAFSIWSRVAPIDFVVKREGRVHIDIRFASGDHGDGDAFDGPGNTLAHAYFPQYGGDAHFDDQEYWTVDSYAGTNIFQVAAHELGHSLGLGHSNVREALMAPFYQKYKPNFKLHPDDVLAIQALYGEKADGELMPTTSKPTTTTTSATTTTTTTTTSMPTASSTAATHLPRYPIYKGAGRKSTTTTTTTSAPSGERRETSEESDERENGIQPGGGDSTGDGGSSYPADLCSDATIDAITRTEDGNTYAFKGDYYWLLVNEGVARGYPRRIGADWEGLPGHLDAALTWADGKTFFFKGNKYWRFKNKRRDVGYPKLISAGFAGVPDDLDAALVWSGNGRTYFFKGAEYWRFDSKADPPVGADYPRPIKVWAGVPAYLNAAFKWENNVTYFFKGQQYYRFNDKEFRVESRGRPAFPRQTSEWWFGCVNSNLAQRALSGSLLRHSSELASQLSSISSGPGGEPSDWSFLAGLSENSTRPLGTHISDHRPPPPPPVPPPSVMSGTGSGRSELESSLDTMVSADEPGGRSPITWTSGSHNSKRPSQWQPNFTTTPTSSSSSPSAILNLNNYDAQQLLMAALVWLTLSLNFLTSRFGTAATVTMSR